MPVSGCLKKPSAAKNPIDNVGRRRLFLKAPKLICNRIMLPPPSLCGSERNRVLMSMREGWSEEGTEVTRFLNSLTMITERGYPIS